jgi:hypothetical protein
MSAKLSEVTCLKYPTWGRKIIVRWLSVRLSGWFFLIAQAVFLQMVWTPDPEVTSAGSVLLVFDILTALILLASIGFLLLNYIGWLLAMVIQGICLFAALLIHFQSLSLDTQLTMLYSIFMVLYLNSFFVRTAFGTGLSSQDISGDDE